MDDLLDGLNFKQTTTLRPTMHMVKVYSPLISAISKRNSKGLDVQNIQLVSEQIEGIINSILSANKLPIPGQEWQRATIRNAIIPLCSEDLAEFGGLQPENWLNSVCSLIQTLKVNPSDSTLHAKEAAQVKLALSDCTTQLLKTTQEFSFLHPQDKLLDKLIKIVFFDSKQLCTSLEKEPSPDLGNLMTNFLRNHTLLMIAAIESEQERILPTLTKEVVMRHSLEGLPLDGILSIYENNKTTLSSIIPELLQGESTPDTKKTPNFLKLGS